MVFIWFNFVVSVRNYHHILCLTSHVVVKRPLRRVHDRSEVYDTSKIKWEFHGYFNIDSKQVVTQVFPASPILCLY